MNIFKQWFCKHEYKTIGTETPGSLFGFELFGSRKRECTKCGKQIITSR